nr:transposase [Salibacterium salarium]
MKRNKEVLWKSPFRLTEEGKERVEELLSLSDRLRQAYELKNALDDWFKTSDETTAKAGLETWMEQAEASGIASFHSCIRIIMVISKASIIRPK